MNGEQQSNIPGQLATSTDTQKIMPREEAVITLFQNYPAGILKGVLSLVEFHSGVLNDARKELEEAQTALEENARCLEAAEAVGIADLVRRYRRLDREIQKDIQYLQKKIAALEAGFLQVPRFDWARLEWSSERLDYGTLRRLEEAKKAGLFDSFGVVQDQYTASRRRRDPFLVGILMGRRGREEHFFIGAWR